ncbi:MAG: hypothetical protein ABF689_14950, partial [Gluconobacter cerinus]|uniref:hypothetical protein n=1 Tax=Gluconobacter cerinus TaxID=38307 RepID=UPI0039E8E158
MTIIVSIKANDGIILAADSATTISNNVTGDIINVYNNADKIFNLYKGLPVGSMTCGSGNIGQSSISTLSKDIRKKIIDNHLIDKDNYRITEFLEIC